MAKRINVNIEVEGGVTIHDYTSIKIDQDLFEHHTFEIVVPYEAIEAEGAVGFQQGHKDLIGRRVTFTLSPVQNAVSAVFKRNKQDDFVFKGIIINLALRNTSDLNSVYVIKGYSPTIVLDDGQRRRWLLNLKLKEWAEKVLQPYPTNVLKSKVEPIDNLFNSLPVDTPQYDESNFYYLQRVAQNNSQWCYYTGTEFIFGKDEGKTIDFLVDGVQSFELGLTLTPTDATMRVYDHLKNETYQGNSQAESTTAGGPLGEFTSQQSSAVFNQPANISNPQVQVGDKSVLDALLRQSRQANQADQVRFKGHTENPNLAVGTIVKASAKMMRNGQPHTEDFGKFRVIKIAHRIDKSGNYEADFEALPEVQDTPPNHPRYTSHNFAGNPVGVSDRAEVIDNVDTSNEGRVRVKFIEWAVEGTEAESPWMQVGTPYSGSDRGFLFIPEVGAQVIVAYKGGNVNVPYVATSVYKETPGIDYTSDPKNNFKTFATRGGNRIYFSDEDGEEMIVISNIKQPGTLVSLYFKKGSNKIRIKTPGQVAIEASDTTINTGTFSLTATKDIKIKGKNITMTAEENTEIKTEKGDITIDGFKKSTVKGGMGGADIDSGGPLKIKGNPVEIDGGPTLTLKGGIVKIN
jgi:type VI secretion system secreted protein VgrG